MYLENRDVRITHVEIKPIMNGNVFADANTGLFTKYQVSADGKKLEFETTEKAALPVRLRLSSTWWLPTYSVA